MSRAQSDLVDTFGCFEEPFFRSRDGREAARKAAFEV